MKFLFFILPLSLLIAVSMISCGDDSSTSNSTPSSTNASASAESSTSPSSGSSILSITASAAAGNGYNTITWTSLTGATSYNLYWSTSSDLSISNGTRIPNVTSPYTQSNLVNGTKIYYLVSAVAAGSEIGYSDVLNATPAGVAGVTAASGNQALVLSWGAISGASSYNLYYSTSSGITTANSSRILSVSSPYTLTGLTNGTTYYILVTGVISGTETSASTKISKAPIAPPSVPSSISVTSVDTTPTPAAGSLSEITSKDVVSWSSVTNATSYNIYWSNYSTVSPTTYSWKANISSTTYTNDRGTDSTKCYYVVTALIESSESAASTVANGSGLDPLSLSKQ